MRVKKFMGMKLDKKMSDRATFTARLLVLSLVFFSVWLMSPTFPNLKFATAKLIALTTGSEMVVGMDGAYFVTHGSSAPVLIVTDCVGWKELFVLASLFLAWPKRKSWRRLLCSVGIILVYNMARLDFLVLSGSSFDYFHPGFQLVSMAVVLGLWLWSVGKLGGKLKARSASKPRRKKAKPAGKKAKKRKK